jgi:hypothetical protein
MRIYELETFMSYGSMRIYRAWAIEKGSTLKIICTSSNLLLFYVAVVVFLCGLHDNIMQQAQR